MGESRNSSLAPPAGGSHDRAGVASDLLHAELDSDGECGGRGGLACPTRSTAWTARLRGTQRSAAGARGNDGRRTGYPAGRRPATGTPAFRVCRTGFGFSAHRRLGRTALDAAASSACQARRRACWRCHHRALVRDWLEPQVGMRGLATYRNLRRSGRGDGGPHHKADQHSEGCQDSEPDRQPGEPIVAFAATRRQR
jgi:hypothetical protein